MLKINNTTIKRPRPCGVVATPKHLTCQLCNKTGVLYPPRTLGGRVLCKPCTMRCIACVKTLAPDRVVGYDLYFDYLCPTCFDEASKVYIAKVQ